ncbi:mechanosensitive ion channel domain-containing protein, partial [Photobacterium phosphoreum]|uniref:mechanosensitive ion channel domain-containing protein n=1 Tax=Photobacterium phosphoreum TaxID=659 RepID=UPI001E32CB69
NAYVPAFLKSLRLLILVVVSMVVLDAWPAFDFTGWLPSEEGEFWIGIVVHVSVVLLIAAMLWTVLASIIEHRLGVAAGENKPTEREKTLLTLFRSAVAVVISTMTALIVLSQIGINIGPLIAGAGVAGIAVGFGAQKLVQDVITGIFIQLENGMNQNDVVEVVGLFGTVEKITIRSVVIRTLDGGYHLIPFSSIDKLTNHMRGYGYHYGEYMIAHKESVEVAIAQLQLAFAELKLDPELAPAIMEDISIPGVTSLNERGLTIRVLIKTTPGMQWMVQRGFNRLVKKYFDAAGIEIPYPQTVLHFGRDTALPTPPGALPEQHAVKL